jgi:hypothetical protein
LDFHNIQPDAGKKKEDGGDARCLSQKISGAGPKNTLDATPSKARTRKALTAAGLKKDDGDKHKTSEDVQNDQSDRHL